MHHPTTARVLAIALGLPLALLLAGPAGADGNPKPERRILLHDHREVMARRSPLDYIDLVDKNGIAYRRNLKVGGRELRVKIYGPVQRRSYGIGIKVKF